MAVIKGKVMWAQVQQPDTKFEHMWHVTVLLETKEQQDQIINDSKATDPKGKGVKLKEDDNGVKIYRFKRKVHKADGSGENPKPLVCGLGGKEDIFDKLIGNGSVCNIQYRFVPYNNKFGSGVTCDLQAIQVLEHIPFGEQDGDAFESVAPAASTSTEIVDEYNEEDF